MMCNSQNIAQFMMVTVLLALLFSSATVLGQVLVPGVEFRAVWVATVDNIDWPTVPALPPPTQRDEIITYLDMMTDTNFNTVIFQVRPVGDTLYDSPVEPWSKYLTGTQGLAPDPWYDPLEFFITEAHLRGIELHAWVNPYRANMSPDWSGLDPSHVANRLSQYAHPYGNYLWMDPGAQAVIDDIMVVINDILTRYDADGIHFDDYFYPYPVDNVPFPDNATYDQYIGSGGNMTLDDWRRDNVNRMVQLTYSTVQSYGKQFSISPFGLYRPGHPDGVPPPITGFDPYSSLYADAKLWLQSGWVDLLIPQIYWEIVPPAQSYPIILKWWHDENILSKNVYAGNAVYRCHPSESDWPISEIQDQIEVSRTQVTEEEGLGNVMFSAKYFRDNLKGITDLFKTEIYPNNATVPPVSLL